MSIVNFKEYLLKLFPESQRQMENITNHLKHSLKENFYPEIISDDKKFYSFINKYEKDNLSIRNNIIIQANSSDEAYFFIQSLFLKDILHDLKHHYRLSQYYVWKHLDFQDLIDMYFDNENVNKKFMDPYERSTPDILILNEKEFKEHEYLQPQINRLIQNRKEHNSLFWEDTYYRINTIIILDRKSISLINEEHLEKFVIVNLKCDKDFKESYNLIYNDLQNIKNNEKLKRDKLIDDLNSSLRY